MRIILVSNLSEYSQLYLSLWPLLLELQVSFVLVDRA